MKIQNKWMKNGFLKNNSNENYFWNGKIQNKKKKAKTNNFNINMLHCKVDVHFILKLIFLLILHNIISNISQFNKNNTDKKNQIL